MKIQEIKEAVRNVPDFPKKGIMFKDITPILDQPQLLKGTADQIYEIYKDRGITKVVGIESRGFFWGPAVAIQLNAGFVPMRKPGKLPCAVIEEKYEKEYGEDALQIHVDALTPEDTVLLHDDLLATGGTMLAAYLLLKKMGVKRIYVNFLIELEDLNGRAVFPDDVEVTSLFKYPI